MVEEAKGIKGLFGFLTRVREKPEEIKREEADEHLKVIEEVENDLRDLINWIEVKNKEEVEGGTKLIEDDVRDDLIAKVRAIAQKLGVAAI